MATTPHPAPKPEPPKPAPRPEPPKPAASSAPPKPAVPSKEFPAEQRPVPHAPPVDPDAVYNRTDNRDAEVWDGEELEKVVIFPSTSPSVVEYTAAVREGDPPPVPMDETIADEQRRRSDEYVANIVPPPPENGTRRVQHKAA